MGFANMDNSLALEFDTWYDASLQDLYNNHCSVQSRGPVNPNGAHHMYSLGDSSNIPELEDGNIHTVQIVYDPIFNEAFLHPALCVQYRSCGLLQSMTQLGTLYKEGDFPNGLGTMSVYIDSFTAPVFIAPVMMHTVLSLTAGNATVGFTAATGDVQWQVHDVFNWVFCAGTSQLQSAGPQGLFGTPPVPKPTSLPPPSCVRLLD